MKYFNYILFLCSIFLYSIQVFASNTYILAKNEYEDIKNKLKNSEKIIINLTINDKLSIDRKVLELISKNNKKIIYNIYRNNNIIYSFIFDGNYFDEKYNTINLGINFDYYNNSIDNFFKNSEKIIFKTNYEGYFPPGTKLSVKNNFKRKKIYLVHDEKISKTINLDKDEYFNIEKGSIYIISPEEIIDSKIIYLYLTVIFIIVLELVIYILIYKK